MNNKFSAHSRLKRKSDFLSLRDSARKGQSRLFKAFYKPNPNLVVSSRLAISVSAKSGNAVMRNLVKRLIREKFRTSKIMSKNIDCLIAFDRFKKVSDFSHELNKDIDALISKLEHEAFGHPTHKTL
ncbi:MAG: ribonuclease P protein component [Bacteriovoracaceae bacterium]|nr:ribonuclease P protein component [Bacteriovoracaceae bacterium]